MGLTEPLVQKEGARRIIVELPGEKNPEKAIDVGHTFLFLKTSVRHKLNTMTRKWNLSVPVKSRTAMTAASL